MGNSVVMNAGDGAGTFDRPVLPAGPFPGRILLELDGGLRARPMVDLLTASATLYGLLSSGRTPDVGRSLSSGVAVFRAREPLRVPIVNPTRDLRVVGGTAVAGAVFIPKRADEIIDEILPRERVHVIQFDCFHTAWGDRADTWSMDNYRGVDRHLKVNLVASLLGAINQAVLVTVDHDALPWEEEARLLSTR